MKKKSIIAAVALVSFIIPSAALADGNHGVKIKFKNTSDTKVEVDTYNGKDALDTIPHKVYGVKPDQTKTIKCHGEGSNKCTVRVVHGEDNEKSWYTVKSKAECEWDGTDLACD